MGIFDSFKKKKRIEGKPGEKNKKEVKIEKKEGKKEPAPLKLKEKSSVLAPTKEKEIKAKKTKKEDTKNAYRILLKPLITEKATNLVSQNKYIFEVANSANKIEVKKAIQSLYGFEPLNVNIIKVGGKETSYGRTSGKRKDWKKAIVTLKAGDKLEIYEGV